MANPERPYPSFITSDRFIPSRFVRPAQRFAEIEASSGIVLLAAAIIALIWANAPFGETYEAFWSTHLDFSVGPLHLEETLREVVNDGFMAIFFFVVGLEIKRELVLGELRDPRAAALPAIAAVGGMVLPAVIYVLFVGGGPGANGWGIPMATDIAFSIGVVALLGSRVPVGAKLFLLTVAVADDIGAISVIAVFYTEDLQIGFLMGAIVGLFAMWLGQRSHIRSLVFYVPLGFLVWFLLLESGVHATLAGVAIGLLTPARPYLNSEHFDRQARRILDTYPVGDDSAQDREKVDHEARMLSAVAIESIAPLNRLEHSLAPWSSFAIVPLFALANAGVTFRGTSLTDAVTHPIALGVAVGLVVGKIFGISIATYIAARLGIGKLPRGVTWNHVIGVSALAGIGFTVSLFITELAFSDPLLADRAKVGIFAGSLIAGLVGAAWLRWRGETRRQDDTLSEPAKALA